MKNLVLGRKIDEIHISELNYENVIEVVVSGIRDGFIYYYDNYWRFYEFNSEVEPKTCMSLDKQVEDIKDYYSGNEVEFRVFE